MLEIVVHGPVDVNAEWLTEKESLRDCQECLALVLHWHDQRGHRMTGGPALLWWGLSVFST